VNRLKPRVAHHKQLLGFRLAKTYRGTPRNLALLAARLRGGELDAVACRKIFTTKGRPATDPLIVHVSGLAQWSALAETNPAALKLARKFWPGPLTIVLPKKENVPDVVTAGRRNVAVRMPAHPLLRRLLKHAGIPLAAPSANPFGYISPTTAAHVAHGLGEKIRYILDGGAARIGVESTIVDLRDPARPKLLRPGAITLAQLERVLGRHVGRPAHTRSPRATAAQLAPGMLARHYSPRTPVELHSRIRSTDEPREAYVFQRKPTAHLRASRGVAKNVFWLDEDGDLRGVAHRLFATLRRLDAMKFNRIHVELAPGGGLGDAINDRLRRAAAR